jgi:hypothetical protein
MYAYYLSDSKKSLAIFYGIIILIYILFVSTVVITHGDGTIGGMEMSSVIFIFVLGLNSFKSSFHFGLANGVSRRTQFVSFAAAAATLGAFMAVIDIIIENVISVIFSPSPLYLSFYGARYSTLFTNGLTFINHIQILFEQFLWSTFLYAMLAMLGFCITLIYYRSNLIVKYVVSTLPFLILLVLVPYVDKATNGAFIQWVGNFIARSMGFGQSINPYIALFSFLIGFGFFALCSYLLMRRAVIRQ